MKNLADSQSSFDKSAAVAEHLIVLAETGSTNDEIAERARAAEPAPEFTVVVTDTQTAGRGRLGRTWVASSGKTLAISVLVRPTALFAAPDSLAWLPLIAGLAMTEAVSSELRALAGQKPTSELNDAYAGVSEATLKWPNDVLIDGFKVSGILTELLADQSAIVIGAGVNLTLDEHDLPTLTSTSLLLAAGAAPNPDRLLAAYLTGLRSRYQKLLESNGDAETAGLVKELISTCDTIGHPVRVELPGRTDLHGIADTIDPSGRLVVHDAHGAPHAIAAGDVTHLRLDT